MSKVTDIKFDEVGNIILNKKETLSSHAVLAEVRAALKDLEDYIRGDTLGIMVSGNDGFDGQEIIKDPQSRDIVMQNIKIIFEKVSEHFS